MAEDVTSNVVRTSQGLTMMPDPSVLTREMIAREIETTRELLRGERAGQIDAIQAQLDAMNKAVEVFSDNLTRVPTDVDKQVGNLDRLTIERFHSVTTRLDGMDEAVKLLRLSLDKRPAEFDARIDHLREMLNERFNTVGEQFGGIRTQFVERDTRVQDAAVARDTAVAAALQAQKEAAGEAAKSFKESIDKSEAATTKLLDALGETLKTATQALDEKINTSNNGIDGKIGDLKDRLTRMESMGVGHTVAVTEQRAVVADTRQGQSFQVSMVGLGFTAIIVILALLGYVATR